MALGEILRTTLRVTGVLEALGIDYLVGGSLASSLHGIPRATQDVDLVVQMGQAKVAGLVKALEEDFYVDEQMIREAIRRRASFNVIELATLFKVDVFLTKDDAVSRMEMRRRQSFSLGSAPEDALVVASPEGIVLQKLDWYRMGHEIAERQWLDILGELKV